RFERIDDLPRDLQGVVDRDWASPDAVRERLPFDQLHYDASRRAHSIKTVDVRDIGMIQCCQKLRFTLKPFKTVRIISKMIGRVWDTVTWPGLVIRLLTSTRRWV